jgi:hypothetical protein
MFGAGCTAEPPPPIGVAEQSVVNPPLPVNLNLHLHAKTTVTIGAFTEVLADVGSSGLSGSVVLESGSIQRGHYTLANTIKVRAGAFGGHLWGNDITVDGSAASRTLGLDPTKMPPMPAVTAATPGTTNVSVAANQSKQLCAGQYGAMTLGPNSMLNLNGGVYHLTRLNLADGARLLPSEPVVLLIAGNVVTGVGASIQPSPQIINDMRTSDIRIEVGGNIIIGDDNQLWAHMLAPNGKLTTGRHTTFTGAGWARTIVIGPQGFVITDTAFSAETPPVPPPCNDNNACTTDQCVGGGTTVAVCRNTAVSGGTSCEDGNVCNGEEVCNGTGVCQPGTELPRGASCADSDRCNGDETCSDGLCRFGPFPVINDGEVCTVDACDSEEGVTHFPLPDGSVCLGSGVCEAGACSIPGTAFSEFFRLQGSPLLCSRWMDFLFQQLDNTNYQSVTMNGSFDPLGVTCTDPALATEICQAMHNQGFVQIFCDGHTWNVSSCSGVEVTIDTQPCQCTFGRALRPCIGNENWGGVGTNTCGAESQTISLICQ